MIETKMNTPQTWNFPGGIYPPERKSISNKKPIQEGPLPKFLIIPLRQHSGSPAQPIVNVGDSVLKGQLIGEATPGLSVNVHAPSSGTIVDIGLYDVQHPSSIQELAIKIETDGQDEWIERARCDNFYQLEKATLIDRIQSAGICGLGGAGFPTHIKYRTEIQQIDTLIINGAECEPYITADDLLMRERATDILQGIAILSYILNPKAVLLGIEDNKPEAIRAMREAIAQTPILNENLNLVIQVCVVPTKYPSGGEKQLIQLLTGNEVPSGETPTNLGILCQNVGTCYAVKKAIIDGEPLISRITTVTGSAIEWAGNYEVLLGTTVDDLLEHCNANRIALSRLIMGGPMMGFTLHSLMIPAVKTTNCIIAGTPEEFPDTAPEQACIRCGHCVDVCPASLLPQQLYWFSRAKEFEKAENHQLMDCIECGACAFVCPSNIPLVQYYRAAKGAIKSHQLETQKSDRARERFEFRAARLAAEKQEKEERRKQRAAQAAARQAKKKTSQEKFEETKTQPNPDPGNTDASVREKEKKRLQTQYASLQKLVRDATKALEHTEKNTDQTDQNTIEHIHTLREQVTQLNQQAEQAKKNWETFQVSGQNLSEKPTHLTANQLKIQAAQSKVKIKKLETELGQLTIQVVHKPDENELDINATKEKLAKNLADERELLENTESKLNQLAINHQQPASQQEEQD